MSHSVTKIWIHGIFSTKNREALITEKFEKVLYQHMNEILKEKFDIALKSIGGYNDHVHVLFLLNQNHSIKDVFHYLKGESSHWINQNEFLNEKFAWQTGYAAFSISESILNNVIVYIENQKNHHKQKSFGDEYDGFIKKYGLDLK
ncbi:MAG: IS200/IS605 family transposase [Ignavibacteria bacterium]|nr:IS200/IS605 family transposase [Ignavibacteria bacterium]